MEKVKIEEGATVAIPCNVTEVGFENERLIDFETMEGFMSGFVRTLDLRQMGNVWEVRGIIDKVEEDRFTAWVKGEFFQAAGNFCFRKDDFDGV